MSQKFNEISFDKSSAEIQNFLKELYGKSDLQFNSASPYGQILNVLIELHQLGMLYLKNSIRQFDLSDVNSNNKNIVRSSAILAGHIPTRTVSATGTIKLKIKPNINIETDIPGARITVKDKTKVRNKTNGLEYTVDFGGKDKYSYNATSDLQIFLPLLQGKSQSSTFTSDGTKNQSFQVDSQGVNDIENFNVEVTINGANWSTKKHLYDMLPNENACVVRTSFNGGIDIIFGNSNFGKIPPIGSIVQVDYITSDGQSGNIFRRTVNDFDFIDDLTDGFGQSLTVNNIFDIYYHTDINFGSGGETTSFTKNLLPFAPSNTILALPEHYIFAIKKLGVFSYVNAYETDGVVYIIVVPNVRLFKNRNSNYFTVNIDAFLLDNYEKGKIDKYLKVSGTVQLTKKYKITTPKLSQYTINILITPFNDEIEEDTNQQIYEAISNYMLDFNRTDRIPKKDIINILADIVSIDSVDINFVCKKNEEYHLSYLNRLQARNDNPFNSNTEITTSLSLPDYNPNTVLGIDPIMGDIIFETDEIPLIRGGFYDRFNQYYEDSIGKPFGSVTILRTGKKTDRKNIIR